ncbi:MAG: cyanophycinase [Cyanobacteria bacterium P01_F01_bin.13]
MVTPTKYPIMVIGGAEDKVGNRTILTAFFDSAGGAEATIGIVPCASQEPSVVGARYHRIFTQMGAKNVHVLDIRRPHECDEDRWLKLLDRCTGVFLSGGDQVRLFEFIHGSTFLRFIKERLHIGTLVLAGTSAGAAVMGEKMISGGSSGESPNRSLVDLMDGLAIIPELLVDQHFHNRNRMARLISAIAAHPGKLGIGIDEDTCAAFSGDGTFEVIGKGTITIIDPQDLTHTNYSSSSATSPLSLHDLRLHVLNEGDHYDYRRHSVHRTSFGVISKLKARLRNTHS